MVHKSRTAQGNMLAQNSSHLYYQHMIEGRTFFGFIKQFVQTPLRYISFARHLLEGHDPRFLILSFGILKKQKILDFKQKRIINVLTPTIQDFRVLLQVFYFEHYKIDSSWLETVEKSHRICKGDSRLILDLGSNIGISALYFSLTIPNAHIILVEPSQRNMDIAKKNTKAFNCNYVTGAIASSKLRMNLVDPGLGPDAFRVEINENGSVETFTVNELLESFETNPFLIKIDIEGSEANLFESNTDWIDKFPFLVVELHDWMLLNQFSSKNFLVEIGRRKRNFIFRNENIFSF